MIRVLLKLEGLAVFLACLFVYNKLEASWPLFFILWLAPDLSLIGYLIDKHCGAILYNLAHTYLFTLSIAFAGMAMQNNLLIAIGVIFTSHIGLDRLLGFGLKYDSGFKDSHLQRV